MNWLKKLGNRIFIEGLTGMAHGLFATLIIGTIIQQIGSLIGGNIGDLIFVVGKVAAALTGAGIGVGVAYRFKEGSLVVLSAATAGMVGAFASKILAGAVLVDGAMVFAGPGEPLGAFLAAFALECFLVPNQIIDGGIVGVSMMTSYMTKINLGLLLFVLNIPFVFMALNEFNTSLNPSNSRY